MHYDHIGVGINFLLGGGQPSDHAYVYVNKLINKTRSFSYIKKITFFQSNAFIVHFH